jgi:hypothetical protein
MMNNKALNDMYETGVLVENPIAAAKYFRERMGYINPDEASTKLVEASQYGFQANWRGQTFDKREYIAGVHNGEMPGADTNTDILQARAMNPYSAKSTNRMDYVNPSWQANVSQYGGNSGTIEMLASGFSRALPMAMDNLEQISANALDENKRQAINDPLSSTYAMVHQGIQEILATDRAARLAAFRGSGQQDQDVRIDMSKGDAENTFNTSYQGPNINAISKLRDNPTYRRIRAERDAITIKTQNKITANLGSISRPVEAPEPMKPKEAQMIFETDMEEKRRNYIRETKKLRRTQQREFDFNAQEILFNPVERSQQRKILMDEIRRNPQHYRKGKSIVDFEGKLVENFPMRIIPRRNTPMNTPYNTPYSTPSKESSSRNELNYEGDESETTTVRKLRSASKRRMPNRYY